MGEGKIWLDCLECDGSETSIYDCTHTGWGVHNCDHSEDVAVRCAPNHQVATPTTTTSGHVTTPPLLSQEVRVRLVGGSFASEGRIEVEYQGEWGTICNDDFDLNDAHVICRMLGYK